MAGLVLTMLLLSLLVSQASSAGPGNFTARQERLLSIFSVIQFSNTECSGDSGVTGLCLTSAQVGQAGTAVETDLSQCAERGGAGVADCAAGFGVCCLVVVQGCGAAVAANGTYLALPPSPNTWYHSQQH